MEAEKVLQASLKADEKNVLAEAKKKGKEVYAAEKARITMEKAAVAEAKRIAKLHAAAVKQAEKARLSAEKKAKTMQRKVCLYLLFICWFTDH
jgi:hypothetical protein